MSEKIVAYQLKWWEKRISHPLERWIKELAYKLKYEPESSYTTKLILKMIDIVGLEELLQFAYFSTT